MTAAKYKASRLLVGWPHYVWRLVFMLIFIVGEFHRLITHVSNGTIRTSAVEQHNPQLSTLSQAQGLQVTKLARNLSEQIGALLSDLAKMPCAVKVKR